jgi:DNA-binding NtrC family response regulator
VKKLIFMDQPDQHKILLFETDQSRRNRLRSVISRWGYVPFTFGTELSCFDNLKSLNADLAIAGPLSPRRAFRFINSLKMIKYNLPVLILSGEKIIQDFIDNNGFDDVTVIKDKIAPVELRTTVTKILENNSLDNDCCEYPLIVGNCPEIRKIKELIPKLIHSQGSVLVLGEKGTGKELIARVIHNRSERQNKPFVKVNVVELPYRLLEGELFGYDPETIAGLHRNKNGMFAVADKGILYFENIEALPAFLQAKLLQIVEDGCYLKRGEDENEEVDVRIVASATTDFDLLVKKNKFRKDLYYRLNVFRINIPPLRRRIDDISQLSDFFTDKYCIEFSKSHYELSEKTKAVFCNYHWPGNVSELEGLIRRAVLQGDEKSIRDDLRLKSNNGKIENHDQTIDSLSELSGIEEYLRGKKDIHLKEIGKVFIKQTEKKVVTKALEISNWNRKKAAEMLDISYKSLLNKIKAYNLV